MPLRNPEDLCRTLVVEGKELVIVRPAFSMVFYSRSDYVAVKSAAASALEIYLDLVPKGAISATYKPDLEQPTGRQWCPFNPKARSDLFADLRSTPENEEEYVFVLSATLDGQSGEYGAAFTGIDLALADEVEEAESVLRLEFPWNFVDIVTADTAIEVYERVARLFPSCSGYAGMSFIHTLTFMPESGEEIEKLGRRFLGFDLSHDFVALEMHGRALSAQWLTLLDAARLEVLGGEKQLLGDLADCVLKRVGPGLLIRAAKLPPIVDVNRRGLDIGRLPAVSLTLKPIRFQNSLLVGMSDTERGQEWLDRFDGLASLDWDNDC